jgi:signal transduction histidine kinase
MDAMDALRASDDLGSVAPERLEPLAATMERLELSPGTLIYDEGDPSDSSYLVESGTVKIYAVRDDDSALVAELGPGEMVGDMTALTDKPRTTNAIASSDAVVWKLPVAQLKEVIASDPATAFRMMSAAMRLVLEKDLTVVSGRRQMSELRRAVDLERRTAERLLVDTQMKDERVLMMAHDIRSPVTVIQGCVEMLRQQSSYLTPERVEKLLEAIGRQGMGLLDLVNDALQVTSIEAGSVRYEMEAFDITKVANQMADDLSHADPELVLKVNLEPGLPLVMGDERHHWRILFNLLSNAIKFSSPGSPIEVRIGRRDSMVQVDVIDQGIGIASSEITKLFEKYGRLDHRGNLVKPDSTGLGLYICKSLVEGQGGTIWVASEPGKGSTFSYTLPIAV